MNRNRRKYKRIHAKHLLNYRVIPREKAKIHGEGVGLTQQVSEGGFLFETNESFPAGTALEFELAIQDQVIRIVGTVIYILEKDHGHYDLGIKFADISPKHRTLIRAMVQKSPDSVD